MAGGLAVSAAPHGGPLGGEAYARAALTYLAEPADWRLNGLISAHGATRTLEAIRSGRLPEPSGDFPMPRLLKRTLQQSMERWRVRLDELPTPDEVLAFHQSGIRLICPGDPEWPEQLADLGHEQPNALWLRGAADLPFHCLRAGAVASAPPGPRRPTAPTAGPRSPRRSRRGAGRWSPAPRSASMPRPIGAHSARTG